MRPAKLLTTTAILFLCACTPPTHYPSQAPETSQHNAVIPAQPPVQRARQDYLNQTAVEPVTCTVGADCSEKWAHAMQWVNMHSQYSVKTSSDNEISTNGPIVPTTDAAFTITRTQGDGNTMAIRFSATCGEGAACVPTVLELNADFKSFLLNGVTHGDF